MAVKIRLKRMGKKKRPTYRVVVADARAPRDGRIIELIGRYDPHPDPSVVKIDNERAKYWLGNGAQPTDRVRKLLEISGAVKRPKVSRAGVYLLEDDDEPPPAPAPAPVPETPPAPEAAAEAAAGEAAPETPAAEAAGSGEEEEEAGAASEADAPGDAENQAGAEAQAPEGDADSKTEGGLS